MREYPIIFSGKMVRAILDGRKTQTRRILNDSRSAFSPYGYVGDNLWVRETWTTRDPIWDDDKSEAFKVPALVKGKSFFLYRADYGVELTHKWRPSIYMPRWASRITLCITGLETEALQDISEEDAKAEGVKPSEFVRLADGSPCYTIPFQELWESIHGIDNPKAWGSNPLVRVIEFELVKEQQ